MLSIGALVTLVALATLSACSAVLGFEDATPLASSSVDGGSSSSSTNATSLRGPSAAFTPVAIDFGQVECGGNAPPAQALTVSNKGDSPLKWSASITPGTPFHILGDVSGTLAADDEVSLALTTDAIDADSTSGEIDQAALTLSTNDPQIDDQQIQIQRTVAGAVLYLDPESRVLSFATNDAGSVIQRSFTLHNLGNRAVNVAAYDPSNRAFAVAWTGKPATVACDAEGGAPFTVTYDVTRGTATADAITFDVDGPLCGDPPAVVLVADGTGQ